MARSLPPYDELVEDDYIEMDISSFIATSCYSMSSPPHSREFEFQMTAHLRESGTTTSPADELFYKGKLLPLHLPPRLQMVKALLQSANTTTHVESFDLFEENTPSTCTTTAAAANTAATTPFESCNISPANSCYVSGELNPEEYFGCSAGLMQSHPKISWSKKLKFIKQTSLVLRASQALKFLFSKPGCSDKSCTISKGKEYSNANQKAGRKNPFGQINRERYPVADTDTRTIARSIDEERLTEDNYSYRRSFSGVIKRYSRTKTSSTSSSSSSSSSSSFSSANSGGLYVRQMLKRSSSVSSEVERSIQGAIAYCKKSQQPVLSMRKSTSDVRFCSLSASRIVAACENKEKPGLCRG